MRIYYYNPSSTDIYPGQMYTTKIQHTYIDFGDYTIISHNTPQGQRRHNALFHSCFSVIGIKPWNSTGLGALLFLLHAIVFMPISEQCTHLYQKK